MKPVSTKREVLNLACVQAASSDGVYRRGVQYFRRKKVLKYEENEKHIEALVIGSEPQPYRIKVEIQDADHFIAECSCPYFEEVCKHSVSVLLTHIARHNPGIRFEMTDGERPRETEEAPRAKDLLEAAPATKVIEVDANAIELGVLILERPLALIIGIIPPQPQGKVNILKIQPEFCNFLEPDSNSYKLAKYLTLLPQATKGQAGGHRIPRGDEGIVLAHARTCAKLVNTSDCKPITFSPDVVNSAVQIKETENGELEVALKAVKSDGTSLENAVFFLGNPCWVLSDNVLYSIDLQAIHRLFQFFDAHGKMTVKLEVVPKFLAVDLPTLQKRMTVILDESSAPFPVAVVEPPRVVIKVQEKNTPLANSKSMASLDLSLGFLYGNLVLPSRDETSAVESELYTRTISEQGQSVWVKRLWEQEGQVRRFLTNLHPQRTIADRFFFSDEAALDVVYYLSSEQCSDWSITGLDNLSAYKVRKEPLSLTAKLSLKKDSYKFDFDLVSKSGDEQIAFGQVLESILKNRSFLQTAGGENVKLPIQTLMSLIKAVGSSRENGRDNARASAAREANGENARPLYQALPIANALEAHGVQIEADEGFKQFIDKLHNFLQHEAVEIPKEFDGTLREYQHEGLNWLSFLREYGLSGILADDMGLGKTIQTLTLLLSHHKGKKRQPSLVVAPTSVVYNWMSEAQRFTPTLNRALFLGRDRYELLSKLNKESAKKPDVIFTTYGILRRDYEQLKKYQFEYLILDEAQNIKNPESVGAIAAKSLQALHRIALSGTPIENRLKELWSLFDFLMPEFLNNYKDFNETYERPIEAGIEGVGLKLRRMVQPFILRRLKSQVEKELPEKTDIISLCEMDEEQRSLYLDVLDECRQKVFGEIAVKGIGRSQISVLAALLRLRQVCCDPRLLKNRDGESIPASAKLDSLVAMLEEVVNNGHKVLVFSQFVEMLALIRPELEKAGFAYEYIDGQVPAKERLDRVNRFNADDSIPIFLISLKAGGTGLNLTGADYVIHYDPWWNPAVENQATDRAHRIGQTKHVFNYKLITRGSVEEKILALQSKKKKLADLVIGGDEGIAKELTKEDLEFLFSA